VDKAIDITRNVVQRYLIGCGQLLYILWVAEVPWPIGIVCGVGTQSEKKTHFEVYWSYVLPHARRCGVRTKINETILKEFDVIRTLQGSKEGGRAFLIANGFTYDRNRDDWTKVRGKK
jgi:hypothetical protein